MKKVITGEMPNLVHLDSLTDINFVGIEFKDNNIRAKVVKIKDGSYVAISLGHPVGEYLNLIEGSSIQDLYNKLGNSARTEVYIFYSAKEMSRWLTEKS